MVRNLLLLFFLLFTFSVLAQKENYIWYFGSKAGVTFHTTPPSMLTDGAMSQKEGCAVMSDKDGNLLFYTNGISVWDRTHTKMPHGDSLLGGNSATQSALIVPNPEYDGLYYIFTVQQLENPQPTALRYSIVDMNENNGNGDVVVKNVFLISPVTEKLCAVKHSNGADYWVMVHGYGDSTFYALKVSGSGISLPVVNSIGPYISSTRGVGQMKFSSDGKRLGHAASSFNFVDVYDFDASTGMLSNEKYLPLHYQSNPAGLKAGVYGFEFSGSGNMIYATVDDSAAIYQWDLSSNDTTIIRSTYQKVASLSNNSGGALQIGPDLKIYFSLYGTKFLSVINNPEASGTACNFVEQAVSLGTKSCQFGLPNFIASYFLSVGLDEEGTSPELTLYPNPARDKITVSIPSLNPQSSNLKLFLRDMTGRIMFEKTLPIRQTNSTMEIDLSGLAKGIYLLQLQDKKIMLNKKLVIE